MLVSFVLEDLPARILSQGMFKLPISPHRSGTGCVPSLGTDVCIFNLRVAWLYVLKTWVGVQEGLKIPFRIVMRWIDSWPYNGAGGEALHFYISQISCTIQAFLFWLPFLKIIDMVSWPRSYCGWQHVDPLPLDPLARSFASVNRADPYW